MEKKQIFIGFDGYIDRIEKVVQTRYDADSFEPVPDIGTFGKMISEMQGLSGDMEIVLQKKKFGGNAPIMANAMATLGFFPALYAAIGEPVDEAFNDLNYRVTTHSLGENGTAHALEFEDGKVMLADNTPLSCLNSKMLEDNRICNEIKAADLIALVNWAQIPKANEMWDFVLKTASESDVEKRIAFFDLADFSKRTMKDVSLLIEILRKEVPFRKYLSLNLHEAKIFENMFFSGEDRDIVCLGSKITKLTGCTVVIHDTDNSVCVNANRTVHKYSYKVDHPKISTGGGDHFNGGFCAAVLAGFSEEDALTYAMGVSGAYVMNGVSPSQKEVNEYINKFIGGEENAMD